jgi:hypothetical protein
VLCHFVIPDCLLPRGEIKDFVVSKIPPDVRICRLPSFGGHWGRFDRSGECLTGGSIYGSFAAGRKSFLQIFFLAETA